MSPIYIGNKKIVDLNLNDKSIDKVYIGEDLVYQKSSLNTNEYIFNIDTSLDSNTNFALNLVNGYKYKFTVDWGDGTSDFIDRWDDINKSHTYSEHGEYTITVTGLVERISSFGYDANKITSAEFNADGYLLSATRLFDDCSNLTSFITANGDWCKDTINMAEMFRGCSSLTTLDVSEWNTQSVTNMGYMFYNCSSLTTLDVSEWNTQSVTNMSYMFSGCSLLTTLDVSEWNTHSVTTMYEMFSGCSLLTTLDVSGWNTQSVTTMDRMFNGCSSLTELNVSEWNTQSVETLRQILDGCSSLQLFDMTNWILSNIAENTTSYLASFRLCGNIDLRFGEGFYFNKIPNNTNHSQMIQNTTIPTENYDNLLSIMASQPLNNNISLGVGASKYSAIGEVARDYIINTFNWTISDGGLEV